jgi:N-acetylglucosaminyldiphosphoundecaprenol N-acetyl-beta-D-mannosaminyltransferase
MPAVAHSQSIAPARKKILGVGVDVIGFDEVVKRIEEWQAAEERRSIMVANPHSILICHRDREMMAAKRGADLVLSDGVGTTLALRVLYRIKTDRLRGPELMLRLFDEGRAKGLRHFLYGGRPEVLEKLCQRLQKLFPEATICGAFSPPFRPLSASEDEEVVEMISNTRPDVVWVGLGAPKQEKWIAAHVGQIRAAALIGVGAAFDFHAGAVPWAPKWIRSAGLEWAYRLGHEPKRLWRRNLDSPRFLYLVLKQRMASVHGSAD